MWSEHADQASQQLKEAMISTPVLALLDFSVPFTVETDACHTGVGAVLSQQIHPIGYFRKSLGLFMKKSS
jgi:hypothetical protein